MKTISMTGFSSLDPQFDRFLYAPLCEQDEMTVSVLSALTRQSVDPWQLAAQLTQLSKAQAVKTLVGGKRDSCSSDRGFAISKCFRLGFAFNGKSEGPSYDMATVRHLVGSACFVREQFATDE
jgi:hypothetical protein